MNRPEFLHLKLPGLLYHPVFLSLVFTLVVLFFLPAPVKKYQARIEESEQARSFKVEYWADLEHDGTSDRIAIGSNTLGNAAVTVWYAPFGTIREFDFPQRLANDQNNDCFVMGRPSDSGELTLGVFTRTNDSLFLGLLTGLNHKVLQEKLIFISILPSVGGKNDVSIVRPRFSDIDEDGMNEIIFGVSAGYSVSPRAVFLYDFSDSTLLRSPETGSWLNGFQVADVTGDSRKEIITQGYAAGNIRDSTVAMDDSSAWVMILDHRLRNCVPPLRFRGWTGGTGNVTVQGSPGSKDRLYGFWNAPAAGDTVKWLYRILPDGQKMVRQKFTGRNAAFETLLPVLASNDREILFRHQNGDLLLFDTALMLRRTITRGEPVSCVLPCDIDDDGAAELAVFSSIANRLTIYRNGVDHPVNLSLKSEEMKRTCLSVRRQPGMPPQLCITSGHYVYLVSYEQNPAWKFRWLWWAGIWFLVFLVVAGAMRLQKLRIERRLAAERKITDLQLTIVRNQIDPHFTLNAINSVVDAIGREEKEAARENLLHFSRMYRSLVLSGDKFKRTLQEEIDFTENYLALERFRLGNRFVYAVEVDPAVDLQTEVPKMVIQSAVENAVKHGIRLRETTGRIGVSVRTEGKGLLLEIDDNGPGRDASAAAGTSGTGRGMAVMGQFFELYRKVTGVRVDHSVTDLTDADGQPAGTRVAIRIRKE